MQVQPYLFFKGNCAAALARYEAIGLGKVVEISHYKDAPGNPFNDANKAEWVMHATLTGPAGTLMASDGMDSEPMKGFSLSIGLYNLAEAYRLFDALAEGGRVRMPMAKQFWGAVFGQLTDRFGVQWMINCEAERQA